MSQQVASPKAFAAATKKGVANMIKTSSDRPDTNEDGDFFLDEDNIDVEWSWSISDSFSLSSK